VTWRESTSVTWERIEIPSARLGVNADCLVSKRSARLLCSRAVTRHPTFRWVGRGGGADAGVVSRPRRPVLHSTPPAD